MKCFGFVFLGIVALSTAFVATSAPVTSNQLLGSPADELSRLDERTPVPMPPQMALHQKQNMREHLQAVEGIISGLLKKDFKSVSASAKEMGYSLEMGHMCQMMGAGAAGFTDRAIQFHKTADEIILAADKKNERGVMSALQKTLLQCTGCHSAYRQQVVDQATYSAFSQHK